ncbi:MAG: HAMP domain-containing histidine kinase [Deltaproteobacteria bacterium]|nr:HAMP domain-containing histidine kinase [Deltaproteobacteria bacterium]
MAETAPNSGKILIFGDEARRLAFLEQALGVEYDVSVRIAHGDTGGWAVASCPDLIVVDVLGDQALELCRLLKRESHLLAVPLLMLADDEEIQVRALELGAADCMARTLNLDVLKWKIRNLVKWRTAYQRVCAAVTRSNEKIAELEAFIQMVAHDLKSPALAVDGFVRMLKRTWVHIPTDPRIDQILHHLSSASNTIQDFLHDISGYLEHENLPLEWNPIQLDLTVKEVTDRYRPLVEEKGIRLELDLGDTPARIVGDRRRITQVLDNLINNAIVHMGKVPDPCIMVRVEDEPDFVIACIADNGVGIPPQYQEKVFRRFFRVPRAGSAPGTGLGLFISKCIVESHSGRIWIEPADERGFRISFRLPKARAGTNGENPGAWNGPQV